MNSKWGPPHVREDLVELKYLLVKLSIPYYLTTFGFTSIFQVNSFSYILRTPLTKKQVKCCPTIIMGVQMA